LCMMSSRCSNGALENCMEMTKEQEARLQSPPPRVAVQSPAARLESERVDPR
jgi:hypothetical protein